MYYLLENVVSIESAYSKRHYVLGNLQPTEGYDFQKVLHIRKIKVRMNMVFQKCITIRKITIPGPSIFRIV